MIAHLVLFRPRATLDDAERAALVEALAAAIREIPSVREARVGVRVTHGRPYEKLMAANYTHAAILEFEDVAGLQAYLDHPLHDTLAARFFSSFEDALFYDYDMASGVDGVRLLIEPAGR